MNTFLVSMYVYHMYTCACGGQMKVLDPLELELHINVHHHMSDGNKTRVFCKRNK